MKPTKTEHQIKDLLKELRMPVMREVFSQKAIEARKEQIDYLDYLKDLLEIERVQRREKSIERHLRESRLPLEKNFASLDMKRFGRKIGQQMKVLRDGSFIGRCENIIAFGMPGNGKSHLLAALGQELVRSGKRVYFSTCCLLVQQLLRAKKELLLDKHLKKLSCFDAIIIDDIGYVQHNRDEMEVLFSLLAARYEKGSVMITTNLQFSKWESIFKDPMTTAAAIDRLIHHCVILEIDVPSYRMEYAQKNKRHNQKGTSDE